MINWKWTAIYFAIIVGVAILWSTFAMLVQWQPPIILSIAIGFVVGIILIIKFDFGDKMFG